MERATLGETGGNHSWLAIVRQPAGSLELFAKVVSDIVHLLQSFSDSPEETLYQRFLGRVRGWQEFMRQGREGLGPEKELGLVGELRFLNLLLDAGILQFTAVDAWKGPHDGLHDFQIGLGSVEIKSTMIPDGFLFGLAHLSSWMTLTPRLSFWPGFDSALRRRVKRSLSSLMQLGSALTLTPPQCAFLSWLSIRPDIWTCTRQSIHVDSCWPTQGCIWWTGSFPG